MKILELSYDSWDFHLFSLRALNCLDITEDYKWINRDTHYLDLDLLAMKCEKVALLIKYFCVFF